METTTSLRDFIKDEFVPEPKEIPERIQKEVKLDLEDVFCPFCGIKLEDTLDALGFCPACKGDFEALK